MKVSYVGSVGFGLILLRLAFRPPLLYLQFQKKAAVLKPFKLAMALKLLEDYNSESFVVGNQKIVQFLHL
jgi:hypothetical protein